MTDIKQMHDDLKFVREAVSRHDRQPPRAVTIYWIWAVYVLVGYTMLDVARDYAGWFFMIGGIVGGIISAIIGKRAAQQAGEIAREDARREALHWLGGIVLIFAGVFGLATVIPALRGPAGGQVIAVMFGLLYFLNGVHFDRNFLWLGPVLMAGGILVAMIPRYGWTGLGVVVALGLIVPTLFPRRQPVNPSTASVAA
jgi:hypothetical protein